MTKKRAAYLTTAEAARHVRLSARTLERYRVAGGGPVFLKFRGLVRYTVEDLDAWMRTRRRKSTSDDGSGERPALPRPPAPDTGPAPETAR